MRTWLIPALAVMLLMNGCKPADKSDGNVLTINFKASFNNQPLQFNNTYDDGKGIKWRFEELNFYFSNLKLVKENGDEVLLTDLGYADLKQSQLSVNSFNDVAFGKYKSLKFNAGLTPEQNNVAPNFLDEKDVRNQGLYWDWLKYAFVRLEGRADVNNSGVYNTLLVYHVGADELLRNVVVNQPFEVKAGKSQINVLLQVDKIFTTNPSINITDPEESYTHSEKSNKDNYPTALKFADNFSKSFSIQ